MTDSKHSTPTIGVSDFVRRQTIGSEFTHFDDDSKSLNDGDEEWDKVAQLAQEHFHRAKPGYRDGVCLVPVPPEGFHTGVVELREGDKLAGEYRGRRPGEEPRKSVRVVREGGRKARCVAVDVVLYRRDVLEEGNEETTGADWDIVSVNGRLTEAEQPIEPDTLIANHFQLDGGTATGMSPEAFESALRESVMYWKNKGILAQ